MKKLFFAAFAGMLALVISCNNNAKTSESSSAAEKAKANNRAILKAIENGDVSKLDSFITKDGVDHSGGDGTMEVKGLDNIKAALGGMKQQFSDIKFDISQEATNDSYLFVLSKMTGTTSATPANGMPPNKKVEMTTVDLLKFNSDGMLTDHWSFNDPKDMMKMSGGDHSMDKPMDNKMDSSKMKK